MTLQKEPAGVLREVKRPVRKNRMAVAQVCSSTIKFATSRFSAPGDWLRKDRCAVASVRRRAPAATRAADAIPRVVVLACEISRMLLRMLLQMQRST